MNSSPPPLPPVRDSLGENAGVRMLLPVGRSVWAIAAGYLGLFAVLLVFAPPALICGIVAVVDIRKSKLGPKPKHGMGRAVFGIVMGAAGTVALIYVLAAMFF